MADPCFCGELQPPEDKGMMKSINTLKPVLSFFKERHTWLENKWALHRDSPQRLHSKFSARTRNIQACVGGDGETIVAAPFNKPVVPMKYVPLHAPECPPNLRYLTASSWDFLSWLMVLLPQRAPSLRARAALPSVAAGDSDLFSTGHPRTGVSSGALGSCCRPGELCRRRLCLPAAQLSSARCALQTKSSLLVPQGSLLTFMVVKRPLRGFVIILRVHPATLT